MFPSAAATNNPSPGTKTQVNSRIQNHALTYISCVCVCAFSNSHRCLYRMYKSLPRPCLFNGISITRVFNNSQI